jgi:SAM-dependent methyltransferase
MNATRPTRFEVLKHRLTSDPLYGGAVKFVLGEMPDVQHKSVLEVGCGCGEMSVLFAMKDARVVGLDIRADVLRDARVNSENSGVARQCHFVQGSAELLPFSDDSFDVVYSRSTLQYMTRVNALRELARVLRPSGTLVLIENLPFNPIILLYRTSRRLTHRNGDGLEYVRSIKGYVSLGELDAVGRSFESEHRQHYHLIRMLSYAPFRPRFLHRIVDRLFARIDALLLTHLPSVRQLSWFVASVYVNIRKNE